jgi:hypothetical protein
MDIFFYAIFVASQLLFFFLLLAIRIDPTTISPLLCTVLIHSYQHFYQSGANRKNVYLSTSSSVEITMHVKNKEASRERERERSVKQTRQRPVRKLIYVHNKKRSSGERAREREVDDWWKHKSKSWRRNLT